MQEQLQGVQQQVEGVGGSTPDLLEMDWIDYSFCSVCVCLRHGRHTMVLVPMETAGVKLVRPLTVFGQDGRTSNIVNTFNYCLSNLRVYVCKC